MISVPYDNPLCSYNKFADGREHSSYKNVVQDTWSYSALLTSSYNTDPQKADFKALKLVLEMILPAYVNVIDFALLSLSIAPWWNVLLPRL